MTALLLLALPARAIDLSESTWGLSSGVEFVTSDPFLYRRGARVGVHYAVQPGVELGLSVAGYPVLGEGGASDPDWKPLTKELLLEQRVAPDISKLTHQAQLTGRIVVIRPALGGAWEGGLGLLAGAAAYRTVDDLEALQMEGVESAIATQTQLHFGPVVGVFWEARRERFGVRVRWERDSYVETVGGATLEVRGNEMAGAEAMCWF